MRGRGLGQFGYPGRLGLFRPLPSNSKERQSTYLSVLREILSSERGSYTIPNEADAFNTNQAEPDKVDIDILVESFNRTGVAQGVSSECAVTKAAGSNLTFDIAGGDVFSRGRRWTVVATSKTLGAAHATNPRFDLIVVDSAGVVQVRAGAAAANPVFPSLTAGDVALAAVYVPAAETASETSRITDKRMIIRDRLLSYFPASAYGAVGDGSADDTAAIQAALDAANAAGGGVVYLHEGVFKTTDNLTIYSDTTLLGTGGGTIIRQTVADKDGIRTPQVTAAPYPMRWSIQRLRIQSDPASGKCGAGIRISNSRQFYIDHVWIEGLDNEADRWNFGIILDDISTAAGRRASRFGIIDHFWITSISADADSCGIKWRPRVDGTSNAWGFYINNGIVQTQYHIDSDTIYTTSGDIGVWINGTDGTHFHNVEIISFKTPLKLDYSGGLAAFGISNSKFTSVSVESPTSNNQPAILIAGIIGTTDFIGCTAYGDVARTGTIGLKVNGDASGSIRVKFSNSHFIGGTSGTIVQLNNASAITTYEIDLLDCELTDADDGVEINADVRKFTMRGGKIHNVVNAFQINGTHIMDKFIVDGVDLSGIVTTKFFDWVNTAAGARRNFVAENNIPIAANRKLLVLEDEFLTVLTTTGSLGALGWRRFGTVPFVNMGEVGHPGVFYIQSVTAEVWGGLTLGDGSNPNIDADDDFDIYYVWKATEGASGELRLLIGLVSVESDSTPTNGIYFQAEITSAVAPTIYCRTRASDVETSTSTSVSLDTGWHTIEIQKLGGTVKFWLDEVLKATHTANIPTAMLFFTAEIASTGAPDRQLASDYFRLALPGLAR